MPFNIDEFHSELSKRGGPAKQSNFEITVTPPPGLTVGSDRAQALTLHTDVASIPGRIIEPINYNIYGPQNFVGGKPVYPPIGIEVICSPDQRERDLFLAWQDLIAGFSRNSNAPEVSGIPEDQFDMGYAKGDKGYLSESLEIKVFNDYDKKPTYKVKLVDAYPSNVSAQPLAWAQPETMKLQLNITYRYFIEEGNQLIPPLPGTRRPPNFFNATGLGAAIGTGVGVAAGRIGAKRTAAIMAAGQIIRGRI